MEIQERLTSFAMIGATWVLWLLIGLSVIALAIILDRTIVLWRTGVNIRELSQAFAHALRGGDLEAARNLLACSPSFEARVVAAGLEVSETGATSASERMEGATQLVRLQMEKRLAFLGTMGANAPFVGLLGTVIGIIRAFHELNVSAGKVTAGLMSEIGEALVATAIGILVAVPAVAFFNLFQRIIKARLAQADALSRELLAHLQTNHAAS
jgi:biopolymer transport protein ExbB